MEKATVLKIIFFISFIFMAAYHVYAECYNEDTCFKDYVSTKGNNMVVAVNRETNQVKLVWSDKDQTWLKPEKDRQEELQGLYNKKVQLRDMQSRLDEMHRETWYNTNQNTGAHR